MNWDVVVPPVDVLTKSFAPMAAVPLSTTITMSARGTGVSDAVQLSIPIEPFGEKRVVANAGRVEQNESTFTVTVPRDATFTVLRLTTSPSLAAGVIDSLEYLTGYPYGCVEQTMSKALPNAVVGRAFTALGVDNPQIKADLPGKVTARSGRQSIAEGSRAAAASSQTELRLLNTARASLEELLLGY